MALMAFQFENADAIRIESGSNVTPVNIAKATTRAVVIGGGYIGLEAAVVMSKFGKQVTVLEAVDRVLARVAGEPLSRFYEAEHRAHGVDVRLNAKVGCIEGKDGRGGDSRGGIRDRTWH
jgi:NADPH-dependent 2,4-dienoyl-CoA reductase/sulfur reductase-like enzyme